MTEAQKEIYATTVRRLARMGATDPTAQIVALAEEVAMYRGHIRELEDKLTLERMKAGAQYLRPTLEPNDPAISGVFGDPTKPETLLRYWKVQEAAGYPYASENVKYFEEIMKEELKNESTT